MSFDGVFTHTMVNELSPLLTGARLSRISQPYPNELIITVRANRHNYPLLLSAHPSYARLQITEIPFVNPEKPTNFTMTLRKYLDGAILKSIKQIDNDRVVHLTFTARNEIGDQESLVLIIEMMGRHSNIVLVNQADQRIIDTIRHVAHDQNRYRLLLPGATYIAPPQQNEADPFTATEPLYRTMPATPDIFAQAKALQQTYQGFGFDTALELATRLAQATDQDQAWHDFFQTLDQAPQPTITHDPTKKQLQFSPCAFISQHGTRTTYASLSELLDHFYRDKAQLDRVHQQGSDLIRLVQNELKKNKKKYRKLEQTLAASEKADTYRIKGEILTTYLHKVERGMTEVTLPNFYADEAPIKISLSNQLSPSKNAQKYFTKYQKLKNSVHYVNEQLAATQQEIDYFQGILTQIDLAAPKDLQDIQAELRQQGYLRTKSKQQKQRPKLSQPETFYASDGTKILVGKNNLQNDRLTLKTARKTDIWLHAKDIPGSHVIITSAEPSEQTLVEAANLAAYYSKARLSATVPVDTVAVKKIHKPNGAKPGFVIYTGQKTITVTPDEQLVQKLSQQP
ncbi:NFACT RNA binding domain-containing protein [Loigolactobacillus coryniformis]|uniref:NFACT RNA binding domain-containing protein n=1 Tax=Loigolactobacillus coryniformis TaxID=1610 RepID=UPI001C5DB072|nr:NFACT RNA binding domain-containing protein [Loigolactobacillus coryniformis]MBW4802541.1 NFACT family protein [Loigolactobacillus coryniformis subsp. torquens]MBW4805238.1 NFACT family protein [Loigolactobacillus coryniformis subsp. torquens]